MNQITFDRTKKTPCSYRTISTCPLLSKVLDTYIASLYSTIWEPHQAETQFQGKGSSHELAALLLTETIQYSLHSSMKPLFVICLDAKSPEGNFGQEPLPLWYPRPGPYSNQPKTQE